MVKLVTKIKEVFAITQEIHLLGAILLMKQVIAQQSMGSHVIIHGKGCMLHMTISQLVLSILIKLDHIAIQQTDIIAIQTMASIVINHLDLCAQQLIK